MILTGDSQSTQRKTYPRTTLSTTNPKQTGLVMHPSLHTDRLETNCPSHDTA